MTVVSAILHVQQFKTSDLWRHKQCGRINNPQRNVSLLENTFVNVLNSCTESIKNIGSLTFNIIPQIQLYRDCKIWPCRKKFILIFSLYLAYKRISFYIKITTYPLSFKFESQNEDRCSNFAKIFIFLLSNGVFPLLLTENTEQFAWRSRGNDVTRGHKEQRNRREFRTSASAYSVVLLTKFNRLVLFACAFFCRITTIAPPPHPKKPKKKTWDPRRHWLDTPMRPPYLALQ
jgi:hypothetical protein